MQNSLDMLGLSEPFTKKDVLKAHHKAKAAGLMDTESLNEAKDDALTLLESENRPATVEATAEATEAEAGAEPLLESGVGAGKAANSVPPLQLPKDSFNGDAEMQANMLKLKAMTKTMTGLQRQMFDSSLTADDRQKLEIQMEELEAQMAELEAKKICLWQGCYS